MKLNKYAVVSDLVRLFEFAVLFVSVVFIPFAIGVFVTEVGGVGYDRCDGIQIYSFGYSCELANYADMWITGSVFIVALVVVLFTVCFIVYRWTE